MPKLKNHSGGKKRFRKTATGKFTRSSARSKHSLTPVSASRKHEMRKTGVITPESNKGKILEKYLPMAK